MRWALWVLALAAVASFAALGRWQLHRAVEKEAAIANVARVLADKRVEPLAALVDSGEGGYAWGVGRGSFLPSPVLLLDNQRRGNQVGVRVFGIFRMQASRALLVDLGWLPVPGDRRLPSIELPRGPREVSGLVAPPPSAGITLGAAPSQSGQRQWLLTRIDTAELATALTLPLSPRILRLDPALAMGYARDLEVLPNTLPPERHRGYALQWFGLAAAVAVLSLLFGFRRPFR